MKQLLALLLLFPVYLFAQPGFPGSVPKPILLEKCDSTATGFHSFFSVIVTNPFPPYYQVLDNVDPDGVTYTPVGKVVVGSCKTSSCPDINIQNGISIDTSIYKFDSSLWGDRILTGGGKSLVFNFDNGTKLFSTKWLSDKYERKFSDEIIYTNIFHRHDKWQVYTQRIGGNEFTLIFNGDGFANMRNANAFEGGNSEVRVDSNAIHLNLTGSRDLQINSFPGTTNQYLMSFGANVAPAWKHLQMRLWTTANRPASPDTGEFGWNTDSTAIDVYDVDSWNVIKGGNGSGNNLSKFDQTITEDREVILAGNSLTIIGATDSIIFDNTDMQMTAYDYNRIDSFRNETSLLALDPDGNLVKANPLMLEAYNTINESSRDIDLSAVYPNRLEVVLGFEDDVIPSVVGGGAYSLISNNFEYVHQLITQPGSNQLIFNYTPSLSYTAKTSVGNWFYIEDASKLVNYTVELYSSVSPVVRWSRSVDAGLGLNGPLKDGWNMLRWSSTESTKTGWGTLERIRILINTSDSQKIGVGPVYIEEQDKAKVLMIIDGAPRSGWQDLVAGQTESAISQFRTRVWPLTWGLSPELIDAGNPDRLTLAELRTLESEGNSYFSFHRFSNSVQYSTASFDETINDYINGQRWLNDNGFGLAKFKSGILQNVGPYAVDAVGVLGLEATATGQGHTGVADTWPFRDNQDVRRIGLHGRTTAQITQYFLDLKADNNLGIFYTHKIIEDGGASANVDTELTEWNHFVTELDTAVAQGWLELVDYDDLVAYNKGMLNNNSDIRNKIFKEIYRQTKARRTAAFQMNEENDQTIGTVETFWTISGVSISEGFTASGTTITADRDMRVVISVGGGQSNNSSVDGTCWTVLEKQSGVVRTRLGSSTFLIASDGATGRTGGGISIPAVVDLVAGDDIVIWSRGSINSIVQDKVVSIHELK